MDSPIVKILGESTFILGVLGVIIIIFYIFLFIFFLSFFFFIFFIYFDEISFSKQNSPRWDAAFCGVTSGAMLFAYVP